MEKVWAFVNTCDGEQVRHASEKGVYLFFSSLDTFWRRCGKQKIEEAYVAFFLSRHRCLSLTNITLFGHLIALSFAEALVKIATESQQVTRRETWTVPGRG